MSLVYFGSEVDISTRLDTGDYLTALSYSEGPFLGFMLVIHMNVKYPEWNNIRYSEGGDNISIYTKSGWKKCLFLDLYDTLNDQSIDCTLYFKKHQKKFFDRVHVFDEKKLI